jgi:hypothetical protein
MVKTKQHNLRTEKPNLMKTIPARKRRIQEKPPVYRTPEGISDLVYRNFNTLAHERKLTEGTAIYANRMCREESFTMDELSELKGIMTDEEAPTTEISREILGGRETLSWIDSIIGA